jgi:hypothetical protein
VTRSNVPAGKDTPRSCCSQVIAAATPAAAALSAPVSSALCATSVAVTVQPRAASQMASPPWPQPTSSAVPGVSEATSVASDALTFPLQRVCPSA